VDIIVVPELRICTERLSDVDDVAADRRDGLLHWGIYSGELGWRDYL
jgi:hypothetical protein